MARCLSPITVRQRVDGVLKFVSVPCGRCMNCVKRNRSSWIFRLEEEERSSLCSFFLTLTYDDSNLYYNDLGVASVSKSHHQNFLKNLRYHLGIKLRFYMVSEYGSRTFRPHYHYLIFFKSLISVDSFSESVSKAWTFGHFHVGTVSSSSISYVTKYVIGKTSYPSGADKPFTLCSRRPGIGFDYVDRMSSWHESDSTRFYSVRTGGIKVSLPRYYKEKLYSKYDREAFAERCHSLFRDEVPDDFQDHALTVQALSDAFFS